MVEQLVGRPELSVDRLLLHVEEDRLVVDRLLLRVEEDRPVVRP